MMAHGMALMKYEWVKLRWVTAPGPSQVLTSSSMAVHLSEEANRNKLLLGAAKQTVRHHLCTKSPLSAPFKDKAQTVCREASQNLWKIVRNV